MIFNVWHSPATQGVYQVVIYATEGSEERPRKAGDWVPLLEKRGEQAPSPDPRFRRLRFGF